MRQRRSALLVLLFSTLTSGAASAADPWDSLADRLRAHGTRVLPEEPEPGRLLAEDLRTRLRAAGRRETEAWRRVTDRASWETYRDRRIAALRDSLGSFPEPPTDLKVRITRTFAGDGFRSENVVFESRPGVLVTANRYRPASVERPMPGFVIVHSHHNPKTQAELQDMGMTWARQGCTVVVPDQPGHGERRDHPFRDATSFPGPFRVGRQDYYFRYNLGMQLHLVGDSLIGWMAWDLRRCVDLLVATPGVDPKRIALLGSVAGGGDPAAVAAALDPRVTVAVPFNFGGPQPETVFPLPMDAEDGFNYTGSGSWESTRNLRRSAADGFLPWVIVAATAPRGLVYAHEFAWDRDHDPVWKRLERIYRLYGAPEKLSSAAGRGSVRGSGPGNTHCNNIGPEHRRGIYPALQRWYELPIPERESQERRLADELHCLPPGEAPKPLHEVALTLGKERAAALDRRLAALSPDERRRARWSTWSEILGEAATPVTSRAEVRARHELGPVRVEHVTLTKDGNPVVPLLLLIPPGREGTRMPVVVAVCQEGKATLLQKRTATIRDLLAGGVAVCLPDVRGTGEMRPGTGRGRDSSATALSSSELMLGGTLVGARLRDLKSVLGYLRSRPEIAPSRLVLWGESLAGANPPGREGRVPHGAEPYPESSEPLGALLALLGAASDPGVRAAALRGGLVSYASALESPFCHLPHEVVVPGAVARGDLDAVAALVAPRPLRLEALVDGRNRSVGGEVAAAAYLRTREAYREQPERFGVFAERSTDAELVRWLLRAME